IHRVCYSIYVALSYDSLRLLSVVLYAFFLFITCHALTSTLFPYTTLFRSKEFPERFASPTSARPIKKRPAVSTSSFLDGASRKKDRKSTRLNSSHQIISYAVFCLQKNNKAGSSYIRLVRDPDYGLWNEHCA